MIILNVAKSLIMRKSVGLRNAWVGRVGWGKESTGAL